MSVQFDPARVKKTTSRAYIVRFVFGGTVAAFSGLLTLRCGPAVGALFLAFPAILPASLTLVKEHDGEEAAGDDALGAVAGSLGLIAFGVIVWRISGTLPAWLVLSSAAVAWLGLSVAVWLLVCRVAPGGAHSEWLRGQRGRSPHRHSSHPVKGHSSHPVKGA